MKPGSATLPFFGQKPKILDQHTGQELSGNIWSSSARAHNACRKRRKRCTCAFSTLAWYSKVADFSPFSPVVLSLLHFNVSRTVKGDHQRYLMTYMKAYSGYYLTGDGCCRDKDGFYWIIGRIDGILLHGLSRCILRRQVFFLCVTS